MKKLYTILLIVLLGSHTIHGMNNSNCNTAPDFIKGSAISLGVAGIIGLLSYYPLYKTKEPAYIAALNAYCARTANKLTEPLRLQDCTNCLNEYSTNQEEIIFNKQMRLTILQAKQRALEELSGTTIPAPSSSSESTSYTVQDQHPISDIFIKYGTPSIYQDCCTQETSKREKLFKDSKTLDQKIQTTQTVNSALEDIHNLKTTQIIHHTYEPDLKKNLQTISSQLSGAANDLNSLKKAFSGSWWNEGIIVTQLKQMNANLEKVAKNRPGSSSY